MTCFGSFSCWPECDSSSLMRSSACFFASGEVLGFVIVEWYPARTCERSFSLTTLFPTVSTTLVLMIFSVWGLLWTYMMFWFGLEGEVWDGKRVLWGKEKDGARCIFRSSCGAGLCDERVCVTRPRRQCGT